MRRNHTLKLTFMTVSSAILFLVYTSTQILSSVQLDAYATDLDAWFIEVLLSGCVGNDDLNCAAPPTNRPSVALRALSYASLACVPLLNGLVFASVEGLLHSVKALLGCSNHETATILPSSGMSILHTHREGN
jgi:hypothetical protein